MRLPVGMDSVSRVAGSGGGRTELIAGGWTGTALFPAGRGEGLDFQVRPPGTELRTRGQAIGGQAIAGLAIAGSPPAGSGPATVALSRS